MRPDGVERIAAAFPSRLAADVAAVWAVVPPATTLPPTSADIGPITLAGERLRIPQRIYWAEPTKNAARSLRERERLILAAIYTRHHDGFVRERALREVNGSIESLDTLTLVIDLKDQLDERRILLSMWQLGARTHRHHAAVHALESSAGRCP